MQNYEIGANLRSARIADDREKKRIDTMLRMYHTSKKGEQDDTESHGVGRASTDAREQQGRVGKSKMRNIGYAEGGLDTGPKSLVWQGVWQGVLLEDVDGRAEL